jgi:hypothetical protein
MAGVINKRQQVRNERALQELIKTVPGNDKCAECGAKNPGTTMTWPQKESLTLLTAAQDGRAGVWVFPCHWISFMLQELKILMMAVAGHFSLHTMRSTTPQTRHAYIKGEIAEHG